MSEERSSISNQQLATGDQPAAAHIQLKVKDQDGGEMFFRMKRTAQLKKLFTAYCSRKSVEESSVVFLLDGRRLGGDQTPQQVDMEDGDEIDPAAPDWRKHVILCSSEEQSVL